MSGITLDAGGLIALDRNDRRVLALIARATERGMRITIPATVLAQAIRKPTKQARLSRLIRQTSTDLVDLDGPDARAVGLLLAHTEIMTLSRPTSPSARSGQSVVTTDPDDLRRIAPELRLVVV